MKVQKTMIHLGLHNHVLVWRQVLKVNHPGADRLGTTLFQSQLFLNPEAPTKFLLQFHLPRVVLTLRKICIQYLHYPPPQFSNKQPPLMVLTLRPKPALRQLLGLLILLIGHPRGLTLFHLAEFLKASYVV